MHDPSHDGHLYDNGCTLCDAQSALLDYANGILEYPPWFSEADQHADALFQIRYLMRANDYPTTKQRLAAMNETYGAPTVEGAGQLWRF